MAWNRWLAFDPLVMIEAQAEGLQSLSGFWIDCGDRDQYHIQYGSRSLTDRLSQLGIKHHWEEFSGTHSGIDHRLDLSLPFLANALK